LESTRTAIRRNLARLTLAALSTLDRAVGVEVFGDDVSLSPESAATMSVMESRNSMARQRVVAMPGRRGIGPCKVPMQKDRVFLLALQKTFTERHCCPRT
jgi:hypothetical protein